jgi:hypothetical protein
MRPIIAIRGALTLMYRARHIRMRIATRLVSELERGTPFRTVRKRAGVSWWEVLVWCLRGRQRFHNSPFAPKDDHLVFLQALADLRHRTGCNLGLILNRVVAPFEPATPEMSRNA